MISLIFSSPSLYSWRDIDILFSFYLKWTHRESNTGLLVANEVFYHWTMGPFDFWVLFYLGSLLIFKLSFGSSLFERVEGNLISHLHLIILVKILRKIIQTIFNKMLILTGAKWLTKINKNLGGDPSAGSPTDTLWRLNLPCHTEVCSRKTSPKHNSVGLTGSVCKRPWHIHRSLITNDYYGFHRHEVGLQTSIWTKLYVKRLASLLRVASRWI